MRLVLATRSAHKLLEVRRILRDFPGIEIVDLEAVGVPPAPEDEEGLEPYDTFEENALSKARYFHEKTGLPTVSDDSGLVVDALDGAPGVRSKRFAPDTGLEGGARDRRNNEHLLDQLGDRPLPERTAHYLCIAALIDGSGERTFRGEAHGLILGRPRGAGGFGYDPLFFDPELGKTFAEIRGEEKDALSHRGKAFRAMARALASPDG